MDLMGKGIMKVIGIDLAGKEENTSGFCILKDNQIILKTLYSDEEIINYVKRVDPAVVAIDAPLSLPKGRCCLEKDCKCAEGGHFRQAERDIRPYGRVLPLTFRGMKMLTLRGIALGKRLREDFKVIETHPRTNQKILGVKDVKKDMNRIFSITGNPTEHELDAVLAAMVGYLYINGCVLELGDPEEGIIVIPKSDSNLEKFLENNISQ